MKHALPHSINVSRETLERLVAYEACLLAWNRSINLIARRDEARVWERHIIDALQLLPLLGNTPGTAIDLGSGAGLPGLVLAIASQRPFILVEADQRKSAFLREAARATNADVSVITERIETLNLPPSMLITARALAPLPTLLTLAYPLLAAEGILLAMKGRTAQSEIEQATDEWMMHVRKIPSITDSEATILEITGLRRSSPPYQGATP